MSLSKTRAPGWYPDRSNPDLLRYYDGFEWTGRQRIRPEWADAPAIVVSLSRPGRRSFPRAAVVALVLVLAAAFGGQGIAAMLARPARPLETRCASALGGLRRSNGWERLLGPRAAAPSASSAAPSLPPTLAAELRNAPSALVGASSPSAWSGAWQAVSTAALRYESPGGATLGNLERLQGAAQRADALAAAERAPACTL